MRLFVVLTLVASLSSAWAQTTVNLPANTISASTSSTFQSYLNRVGMNYFTFVEGFSLRDGKNAKNEIGRPVNSQAFNNISVTYKVTDRLNADLQTRLAYVHSLSKDQGQNEWQFQGMRMGVSGLLLKGDKWALKGAANTDIPELNGRDARYRTLIFNPGLFAGLNYQIDDRWSFYAMLTPRYYFYTDNDAVEPEWKVAGRDPGEKRRLELRGSPTINYAFNDKVGMRSGLDLNFQNFVGNKANYLSRWPTPWTIGPTFNIHKSLNLYTFIQTYPFDGEKISTKTSSIGMWVSGVVF
jgi:hypothetical protein